MGQFGLAAFKGIDFFAQNLAQLLLVLTRLCRLLPQLDQLTRNVSNVALQQFDFQNFTGFLCRLRMRVQPPKQEKAHTDNQEAGECRRLVS